VSDELPYMPVFINDIMAKLVDLDATERGVYLFLMIGLWKAGGSLPFEPKRLARLAGVDSSDWAQTWNAIRGDFDVAVDQVRHPMIDAWRDWAMKQKEGRRKGAATTNAKRWGQRSLSESPSESSASRSANRQRVAEGVADGVAEGSQFRSQSQSQIPSSGSVEGGDGPHQGDELEGAEAPRRATAMLDRLAPLWEVKYGRKPARSRSALRSMGVTLTGFVDGGGEGELEDMPRWYGEYLADNDPELVRARHPLSMFLARLDQYRLKVPLRHHHANGQRVPEDWRGPRVAGGER